MYRTIGICCTHKIIIEKKNYVDVEERVVSEFNEDSISTTGLY